MKGKYIVLEGIIGTGKSTQAKLLTAFLREQFPNIEVVCVREPGGTEIAEAIRRLAQGTKFEEEMTPLCSAYLYAAARAQLLPTVVYPILEGDGIVVSDRSFVTSLTNQAVGLELGLEAVLQINLPAIEKHLPDIIVHLTLPLEIALCRVFDHSNDRWENYPKEFYKKVLEGHKKASQLPLLKSRWCNVKASGSVEEVFERVKTVVLEKMS